MGCHHFVIVLQGRLLCLFSFTKYFKTAEILRNNMMKLNMTVFEVNNKRNVALSENSKFL